MDMEPVEGGNRRLEFKLCAWNQSTVFTPFLPTRFALCSSTVCADSSPLIGLARIEQLGLLPQLARRIGVPRAVWAEVTSARMDAPGASEVAAQT